MLIYSLDVLTYNYSKYKNVVTKTQLLTFENRLKQTWRK